MSRSRQVLAVSGSLRAASVNTALLQAAAVVGRPELEIRLYEGVRGLPHYDPDLEDPLPPEVAEFRALVKNADGLLVSCPEYARGVPGAFKNALDWLVSGDEFVGKLVALFNPSPRATTAQGQLIEIVKTMAGIVVNDACLTLPLLSRKPDRAGILADREATDALSDALRVFGQAIGRNVRE